LWLALGVRRDDANCVARFLGDAIEYATDDAISKTRGKTFADARMNVRV